MIEACSPIDPYQHRDFNDVLMRILNDLQRTCDTITQAYSLSSAWPLADKCHLTGAYCYAELGCMITKSGADYAYIMVTFGPLLAFVRIWIECMIVRPCTLAIQSLTFSIYILKPLFAECDPPDDSSR